MTAKRSDFASFRRPLTVAAAMLAAAAIFAGPVGRPAVAQTAIGLGSTAVTPSFQPLFEASARDPRNVDLALQLAAAATAAEDYEAAIGALERLLFYNPNLPRVRFELGVLYYRLGSFKQAHSYMTSALELPGASEELRRRAHPFLEEIDRRDRTNGFSLFAQIGARYQTNANAGPAFGTNVRALGLDAPITAALARRADWNAFALIGVRHVYDFGNQRGDIWETVFQAYATRHARVSELNLAWSEFSTGPRLAIAPEVWPGLSIRPYAILTGMILADRPYLGAYGGGLSVVAPLPFSASLEVGAETRRRTFHASIFHPTADTLTGRIDTVFGIYNQRLLPNLRLTTRLAYNANRAAAAFNSYDQFSAEASLTYEFEGPFGPTSQFWSVTPFVGYQTTNYSAANALIDPLVRRADREWRFGAQLNVPVTKFIGVSFQASYSSVQSTLPNFRSNNFTFIAGPTARF